MVKHTGALASSSRRGRSSSRTLEITQRCNLDCTLCYLSDLSESIPDIPIEEVKRRADLIVMSTHGRSGLARLVVGSVTEQVLRTTRVPILVIRPDGA